MRFPRPCASVRAAAPLPAPTFSLPKRLWSAAAAAAKTTRKLSVSGRHLFPTGSLRVHARVRYGSSAGRNVRAVGRLDEAWRGWLVARVCARRRFTARTQRHLRAGGEKKKAAAAAPRARPTVPRIGSFYTLPSTAHGAGGLSSSAGRGGDRNEGSVGRGCRYTEGTRHTLSFPFSFSSPPPPPPRLLYFRTINRTISTHTRTHKGNARAPRPFPPNYSTLLPDDEFSPAARVRRLFSLYAARATFFFSSYPVFPGRTGTQVWLAGGTRAESVFDDPVFGGTTANTRYSIRDHGGVGKHRVPERSRWLSSTPLHNLTSIVCCYRCCRGEPHEITYVIDVRSQCPPCPPPEPLSVTFRTRSVVAGGKAWITRVFFSRFENTNWRPTNTNSETKNSVSGSVRLRAPSVYVIFVILKVLRLMTFGDAQKSDSDPARTGIVLDTVVSRRTSGRDLARLDTRPYLSYFTRPRGFATLKRAQVPAQNRRVFALQSWALERATPFRQLTVLLSFWISLKIVFM